MRRELTKYDSARVAELAAGWASDADIPQRYWDAVNSERLSGNARRYRVLREALDVIGKDGYSGKSLIDIGAGAGIYKSILEQEGIDVTYTAFDVSPAFKSFAAEKGVTDYIVGDAADMAGVASDSYDIAVSGFSLLHIPRWQEAISEAARVARSHVILHELPFWRHGYVGRFEVEVYGLRTMIQHFAWVPFDTALRDAGLTAVKAIPHSNNTSGEVNYYTFVCEA